MNTMTDETRQQVTDAALMELLSESENWNCTAGPDGVKMDTFLAQCMGKKISVDEYYLPDGSFDMQRAYAAYSASGDPNDSVKVLCAAYLHDENFQNVTIMDVDDTNGAVVTHNAGSNTYTVSFCGTRGDHLEWRDNADAMIGVDSASQRNAAAYFDMWSRRFDPDANVVVTGHSKGGNDAQYVTMFSENRSMIDQCVALDGQGFSDQAMANMQGHEDFETQRSKITLVCGEDDYVHVLGNRLALPEQTYYLQCNNRFSYDGGDAFMQDHQAAQLFVNTNGEFTYELNGPASQGAQSAFVEAAYEHLYKKLDTETYNFCVRTMMNWMEGSADAGDLNKMIGYVAYPISEVLYYSPEGKALLESLPTELLSNEQMQGVSGVFALMGMWLLSLPNDSPAAISFSVAFRQLTGHHFITLTTLVKGLALLYTLGTYEFNTVGDFLYTNFGVGGSGVSNTGADVAGSYSSMIVDTDVMQQCAARFRNIASKLQSAKTSLHLDYYTEHDANNTLELIGGALENLVTGDDYRFRSAMNSIESAIEDVNKLASTLSSMASVLENAEESAMKYASLLP